jgi:hypothetical protein
LEIPPSCLPPIKIQNGGRFRLVIFYFRARPRFRAGAFDPPGSYKDLGTSCVASSLPLISIFFPTLALYNFVIDVGIGKEKESAGLRAPRWCRTLSFVGDAISRYPTIVNVISFIREMCKSESVVANLAGSFLRSARKEGITYINVRQKLIARYSFHRHSSINKCAIEEIGADLLVEFLRRPSTPKAEGTISF